MKRKVFALLMSVLLIGAMVVGCGSKNSTDSKDTSGDASSMQVKVEILLQLDSRKLALKAIGVLPIRNQ